MERRRPPYTIKAVLRLWPEHDPSARHELIPVSNKSSVQARITAIHVEPVTRRVVGYR